MNEILESIFSSVKGAALSIVDSAPVKGAVAGIFTFIVGGHGSALMAFVTLIVLDLLAKYLALSAKRLTDLNLKAGLWQCLIRIPAAFKDGYIKSEPMKTKFAGKLILYMILVLAAIHVDAMAGGGGLFLKAAWYYLAATEAISIIENLRDAGVKSLEPLLNFMRNKLGGLK